MMQKKKGFQGCKGAKFQVLLFFETLELCDLET